MWSNAVQDIRALAQAVKPFEKSYKVLRQKKRDYNDRGRVDNTTRIEDVRMAIVPGSKRINTNQNGDGRWITSTQQAVLVNPYYLYIGDIIYTDDGDLKVVYVDDNREYGASTAQLVRTGTTERYSEFENSRFEPK